MKKKKILGLLLTLVVAFSFTTVLAQENKTFSIDDTIAACGTSIPKNLPGFTSKVYDIIKVAVPVVIIILGMFDYFNAMAASSEDKAKKEKDKLIRRLVAGALVFFIMVIVEFVFSNIDVSTKNGSISCLKCLLTNTSCDGTTGESTEQTHRKTCEEYEYNSCPDRDENDVACFKIDGKCHQKCDTKGAQACSEAYYCDYIYPNCVAKTSYYKACVQFSSPCPSKDDLGNSCQTSLVPGSSNIFRCS